MLILLEKLRKSLKSSKKTRVIVSNELPPGAVFDNQRIKLMLQLSCHHPISTSHKNIHRYCPWLYSMAFENASLIVSYHFLHNDFSRRFNNISDVTRTHCNILTIRNKGKICWFWPKNVSWTCCRSCNYY